MLRISAMLLHLFEVCHEESCSDAISIRAVVVRILGLRNGWVFGMREN